MNSNPVPVSDCEWLPGQLSSPVCCEPGSLSSPPVVALCRHTPQRLQFHGDGVPSGVLLRSRPLGSLPTLL